MWRTSERQDLLRGFKTDVSQFLQKTIDSDRFDSNAKI